MMVLSDRSLAQSLASNAKEMVKERYSWPVIADKMENLYEKTLKQSHSR